MEVDSSLQRLAEVIENFSTYSSFVKNNLKTELKDRDENRFSVFSEMHIAIPLVSNNKNGSALRCGTRITTEASLPLSTSQGQPPSKERRDYNFKLLSEKRTKFTRLNFWDANWGIAKALAPEKIWRDSVKGLYQADLAFKLIAENPEMELKKVAGASQSETEKLM